LATNLARMSRSNYWEHEGEMLAPSSRRLAFFRRELLQKDERLLVKSICRNCGTVIVGSVVEGLAADEENHISQCTLDPNSPPPAKQSAQ
jgi:hypothetical protein